MSPKVTECFKCGFRVKRESERERMIGKRCPVDGCSGGLHSRELYPRPPFPSVPAAVREWADERIGPASDLSDALEAFVGQLPAHAAEWLDAHRTWSLALSRWSASLPVHVVNDRWRMFGGPWLSVEETVPLPSHGSIRVSLLSEVQATWSAHLDNEPAMRAIAETVYARRDALRSADRRIVAALAPVEAT